jgi:hypothetical protein
MLTSTRPSINMLTITHLRAISMPRKNRKKFRNQHNAFTSAIVTTIEFKQQKNKNSIQYQRTRSNIVFGHIGHIHIWFMNVFSISTWQCFPQEQPMKKGDLRSQEQL